MKKTTLYELFVSLITGILLCAVFVRPVQAQSTRVLTNGSPTASASATPTASPSPTIIPTLEPRIDITQKDETVMGKLGNLLSNQTPGALITNPLKHIIRASVNAGVSVNTIILLLLLPVIAAIIAAARHIVGVRGFGIFLPAALAVVFLAIGPIVGLGLFLVIVGASTLSRMSLRKLKIRLHYMPRMAFMLALTVLAVLLVLYAGSSLVNIYGITNVSIFPVLVLVLLSEDFSRVQLGKSFRAAFNLTSETLVLALLSYIFLTLESVQQFALLNPEALLLGVLIFDFLMGKFSGLRFLEYWRFRKLIRN